LDEITALAGLARLSKLIGSHQERIIRGASRLSRMRVGQVMIPVEQVTFLSTSQRLTDAIVTAHLDPHTRFPHLRRR
jgi:CBS domain containing-hemolysin-like protein